MKQRAFLTPFFIYAFFILIAFPASSRAFTFPMKYKGLMHYGYVITTANGSGTCQMDANYEITLLADGTLTAKGDQVSIYGHSNDKPPTCDMSLTGETTTVTGTHDSNGSFTIPGASPFTGNYNDNSLTGSMTYGSYSISCTLQAVKHSIAIKPTPSVGFDFHKSILEGKGFTIEVHDPDGRDHLDWNTFQVFVAGNDTTSLFWDKTTKGDVPIKDESIDSLTKIFRLIPDPQKLMAGSDIFAIPWNGNWVIELKICDKSGFCFQSKDNVYFGPFLAFSTALDLRCFSSTAEDNFISIHDIMVGNIGTDSPKTGMFIALLNTTTPNDFWTLSPSMLDGVLSWMQNQFKPFFLTTFELPSGSYYPPGNIVFPVWRTEPDTHVGVPAGNYFFITGLLDTDTGAFGFDWHDVQMCNP